MVEHDILDYLSSRSKVDLSWWIYTVSTREVKSFYPQILLTNALSAVFLLDQRNVNAFGLDSFHEACSMPEIIENDSECGTVLCKASKSSLVPVSHVFSLNVAHCSPSDRLCLWKMFLEWLINVKRVKEREQTEFGYVECIKQSPMKSWRSGRNLSMISTTSHQVFSVFNICNYR